MLRQKYQLGSLFDTVAAAHQAFAAAVATQDRKHLLSSDLLCHVVFWCTWLLLWSKFDDSQECFQGWQVVKFPSTCAGADDTCKLFAHRVAYGEMQAPIFQLARRWRSNSKALRASTLSYSMSKFPSRQHLLLALSGSIVTSFAPNNLLNRVPTTPTRQAVSTDVQGSKCSLFFFEFRRVFSLSLIFSLFASPRTPMFTRLCWCQVQGAENFAGGCWPAQRSLVWCGG